MWKAKFNTSAAALMAAAVAAGGLLAQPPLPLKPAASAELARTETELARLRELVRPKPGEYVTNMAKIAWERDPWVAAARSAKEGKPVIAYGPGMVGVPCGYG